MSKEINNVEHKYMNIAPQGYATGRNLHPPPRISICVRQSKTLRLKKYQPNLDLLEKMKETRLALSICF